MDIEERPAIVDLKERFGDLEIDTVIGSNHKGALVTINDRLTSKGTDFSGITDEFVAWVEEKLNNRPRKRLGYLTPNEKFNLLLTN